MRIQRVLMCKPTYFDIEYSINPWMDVTNKVDKQKAEQQWRYVYDVLAQLDVAIELIAPLPGLPDMTFSGDCGMVFGNTFLASNFRHAERQGENAPFNAWMADHGYTVRTLPPTMFFEGLGDVIYYGNDIIFGYGPRSSPEAISEVKRVYPELNVLGELYLAHPDFYHTALALALIDKDTVLYYPPAFTSESCRFIEQNFGRVIAVSETDARAYMVCNNIPIGQDILMDNCTADLERQLDAWGYRVIRCDMSEFKKSGGSVRCLILNL